MDVTRLSQARRLFSSPYVHPSINRTNIRRWVDSLRFLKDKWVALPTDHTAKEMSHEKA